MAGEWQDITIGKFAPFAYGKGLPERSRNPNGAFPVFGSNGVVGWHDKPLTEGPTLIIGRKGTVGAVHFSSLPCWPIDTTFYITGYDFTLIRYRYYLLKSLGLEHMNSDSAVPGLNRNAAHARIVCVPKDEGEQKAIAHILGTLDDKIELNRQMNKTLEEMARAIFKSWFVDFLPVRAKMAARTQAGGLKPEIAKLFSDSFEPACRGGHGAGRDSELGEIPRGWSIIEVGGIGNVVCGKTPPTKDSENYGGEIPFITIPDMHGKVFVTSTVSSLSEKGAGTQSAKLLPKYAVCVSCIATPGLVSITSQPSHTNQQINSIICYKDISPFWCYFAMKSLRYEIITGGSGGSATLNLNKGDFSKLRLIKPKPDIMQTFHATVNPLFARILNNEYESRTLTALRDTLLPKLISGELRIKDAERFLKERGL